MKKKMRCKTIPVNINYMSHVTWKGDGRRQVISIVMRDTINENCLAELPDVYGLTKIHPYSNKK